VLLKYIPIVSLPFLSLERGRIRWRLIEISLGLIGLGMAISCLVWGPSTFRPLRFAATRSSTYLSIFRFLQGQYSPLRAIGLHVDTESLATPLLVVALLTAWWWCRSRRVGPATGAVLSLLVTLLLYRNGFPQYQMVLFMVASYWICETWHERRHRTALAVAFIGYFGWISIFDFIYNQIGDSSVRFENAVGLPTFLLGGAFLVCLIRSEPTSLEGPSSATDLPTTPGQTGGGGEIEN
jgi:hypothetical protein